MWPDKYKQGERQPGDGPAGEGDLMSIRRLDDNYLQLTFLTGGEVQCVEISHFNATRLLGALSLVLGFPLSKKSQKSIRIG